MKRVFLCLCLLCLSALVCAHAQAAEKVRISLLSTPFGTGTYVLGSALESIINKGDYPITVSHTETPGQAFIVNKLNTDPAARKNTVGTASKGINWLAEQGRKPFPARRDPLLLIGSYSYTATWLATADDSIQSIADLRGKRIAMGRIPQVIWGYEPDAILRCGYGEDFYKSLSIQFVGTSEAATALLNGQVDAAAIGGYMDPVTGRFSPAPQTVEVAASGRRLRHLDWTEEAVRKTSEKDIHLIPFRIPAESVPGQSNALWTGADTHGLFAHADFPEEHAYILARAMIENCRLFADYHALGSLMSPEGLIKGWSPREIHPGALRAYREAGLIQ